MNLLVTGAFAWTENEISRLRSLGHDVVFMQREDAPLPCDAARIEGVIANGLFLHHPIEDFTSLRFVQLTSAGFDRAPVEYMHQHDIALYNAKGVYSIPMAEYAVGGVLQLYKQSNYFRDNQRHHRWEKHRGLLELHEKTVCIVGCGSVGNACAQRFKAFGCRVVGVDIQPYVSDQYDGMFPLDRLDDVLHDADVVVLTLPLTASTRRLFGAARFAAMKPDGILVNIARGAIVDMDALAAALKNHLRGAVLDVFEDEPLAADHVLWDLENVIITPHNSFVGDGNHDRMLAVILNNLEGS